VEQFPLEQVLHAGPADDENFSPLLNPKADIRFLTLELLHLLQVILSWFENTSCSK
jgi:hypothetical protein